MDRLQLIGRYRQRLAWLNEQAEHNRWSNSHKEAFRLLAERQSQRLRELEQADDFALSRGLMDQAMRWEMQLSREITEIQERMFKKLFGDGFFE